MPSTQKQWTVDSMTGFDGLKLATDAPIPQVGDKDVLVKCKPAEKVIQSHQPANLTPDRSNS